MRKLSKMASTLIIKFLCLRLFKIYLMLVNINDLGQRIFDDSENMAYITFLIFLFIHKFVYKCAKTCVDLKNIYLEHFLSDLKPFLCSY